MNEPKTTDIDALLKKTKISDFDKLRKNELSKEPPTLSHFFEDYMKSHRISREDVIKRSLMAESYAYQVLNGTKPTPARDRIIALCLAMHMDLSDTNHALQYSNNGALYSKDPRDALIIIAINTGEFDVMKLNEELTLHSMKHLETSKDVSSNHS